jgi:hypothetical protein
LNSSASPFSSFHRFQDLGADDEQDEDEDEGRRWKTKKKIEKRDRLVLGKKVARRTADLRRSQVSLLD